MRRTSFRAAIGAVILAATVLAWPSPTSSAPVGINEGASPLVTTCKQKFGGGAGVQHFSWCYSANGTIPQMAYPAGAEHIAVGGVAEGYAICVGNVLHAYDFSIQENGFGAPSFPAAGKVVRSSDTFRIEQSFQLDNVAKLAKIGVKLINASRAAQLNVQLMRFVDFDMSGTPGNDAADAAGSIWQRDVQGVALTGPTNIVSKVAAITAPVIPQDCAPAPKAVPAAASDHAAYVTYKLGDMPAGTSKSVTFRYTKL